MATFLQNLGRAAHNIGSRYNLPELGISEALGHKVFQAQAPYGLSPTPTQQQQIAGDVGVRLPSINWRPQSNYPSSGGGNVLGTNVTGGGGTPPPGNPYVDNINQGVDELGQIIDQEYNNTINALAGQENVLRSEATTAEQQVDVDYGNVKTQLGQERDVKQSAVEADLATGEKEGANALRSARDLFRQTEQRNIANLSGLGLSSSSVTEALAERLGVETMRRINSVTGSLSEIRINAGKEIGRIKSFFEEKMTNLEKEKAVRLAEIKNSVLAGLNRINQARDQAATAKARQRFDLIQTAQEGINEIQKEAQKIQASMQKWAQQKANALTPLANDPNYLQKLMAQANILNQSPQFSQFNYTPELSYDKYGNVSAKISPFAKKKDELDNPGIPGSAVSDPSSPNPWTQ